MLNGGGTNYITNITIPSTVTSIGSYAFYNCNKLSTINYLGSSLDEWNAISIDNINTVLTSDLVVYHVHNYDDGVTVEGTCSNDGYTLYTCSECGDTYKDDIVEALGHLEVTDKAVAATCTEPGLTAGSHCTICGETVIAQKVVKALGHRVVTDEEVEATCTEKGLTPGRHCSVCGYIIVAQEEVPALGHTEVIDLPVAATCSTVGYTEGSHCSVCGEILIAQEEIPTIDHTEVTDEAVAPTCTESGLTEGSHCSVCGDTIVAQEKVEALGHTKVTDKAVAATCTKSGLTAGNHCSVCNEVLTAQKTVAALGHNYSKKVTKATYTAKGYTTYTCSSCGNSYKSDYTNMLTLTMPTVKVANASSGVKVT